MKLDQVVVRPFGPDDVPEVMALLASRPVDGWLSTWSVPQNSQWWVAVIDGRIEGVCIYRRFADFVFIEQIEGRYEDGKLTRGGAIALRRLEREIKSEVAAQGLTVCGIVAFGNERHLRALRKRGVSCPGYFVTLVPQEQARENKEAV